MYFMLSKCKSGFKEGAPLPLHIAGLCLHRTDKMKDSDSAESTDNN